MSVWVQHGVFWQVDFGPLSLKYFYTLHAKCGVSKPVIKIMWLSHGLLLQIWRVSLKLPMPKELYFVWYFVFEWPVLAYKFVHWSNVAYLPAGRANTERHLVEAEYTISNCENFDIKVTNCYASQIWDKNIVLLSAMKCKTCLLLTDEYYYYLGS